MQYFSHWKWRQNTFSSENPDFKKFSHLICNKKVKKILSFSNAHIFKILATRNVTKNLAMKLRSKSNG